MHIPDNYLSPSTCAAMGAAMLPIWRKAVRKLKQEIENVKIPLLGIGAAFSFIIMMFNIPLPWGTTGHAVGGTLLAVLLGPFSACISITVALLIQALLFGDGGILAFGANCFNMAFVLPYTGYYVYKALSNLIKSERGKHIGIAVGSYIGLNAAALITAIEFGIQPILFKNAAGQALYNPYPLSVAIPAMLIPHLLVGGVIEAVFSAAVYMFIKKASPEVIYNDSPIKLKPLYILLLILICITPLGLLAAGTAWGEWGIDEINNIITNGSTLGYIPDGMKNGFSYKAIMPDYEIQGLPAYAGYILSAIAGAAALVILFKLVNGIKRNKANAEL